ncbi:MAG: hypothetical protein AAGC97_04805 [Planctomycetota bacterium]
MDRVIPNRAAPGNDRALTPLVVEVPLLLVGVGDHCYWYEETMDSSTAERTLFAMMQSLDVETFRVNVPLILPAACDILEVTSELDQLRSEPVRAILKANG